MIRKRRQAGFTVIEMLIATGIFTVILLVMTTAVLQFSKQYYKGVIANSTQNAARTLIDDVSRSIEFNGGNVSKLGSTGYCVGTAKRYSFALNKQVIDSSTRTTSQSPHGLVSDTVSGCDTSTPALNVGSLPVNLGTAVPALQNPRELLGERMRLTKFSIVGNNGVYTITVRVIYGENDLLTNPADPNAVCKSQAGSQYCAISELSTIVKKRVQ